MSKEVLGKIRATIAEHIYHLDQCARLIEQYRLHFYNRKALKKWGNVQLRRSVFHMWIPALISLLFGLRALAFILYTRWFDTPAKRLVIFSEMLPENGRRSFEITLLIWSFLHVFYVTYVIRGQLSTFAVLAIFKVHPEGSIKPNNLGLSTVEYQLLARFRQLARYVCDCICFGFPVFSTFAAGLQGILLGSVLQINATLTISWLVYLYVWVYYVCSAAYGLPIFISVVARYIQVKQLMVLNCMAQLSNSFRKYRIRTRKRGSLQLNHLRSIWHRLVRLQRRNGTIQCELRHYTGLIARCLNIIFAVYIAIICYVTYLLFFTEMTFQFQFLYSQIYAINILLLTGLIMSCSAITRHNPRMRLYVIQFYMQSFKRRLFAVRQLLQIDQMAQNLQKKNGFKLINGFRIDTNAYFGVIYAINIFFFLILKQRIKFLD